MISEWPREHRGVIESQFYLQASSLNAFSPYTAQATPYGPNFQRFVCKVTFAQKRGPDWRALSGLITRLRGQVEAVRMVDYFRMRPGYDQARLRDPGASTWSDGSHWDDGTDWVDGFMPPYVTLDEPAQRDARSVVLRGLLPNVANALRMGDLGEARPNGIRADHGHLYELVHNSRTDAAGKTRIYFEPGLRAGLAAGDMWVLRNPTSVFTLASDSEGVIQRSMGNLGGLGLSLVEKLP